MTAGPVQQQNKSAREAISWTDGEVESIVGDRFNFKEYADVLSERILKTETPSTVGIVGSWGSGKSSLMNIIREHLEGGPQKPPKDLSKLSLFIRTSYRIGKSLGRFKAKRLWWSTRIRQWSARFEVWLLGSRGKDFTFQKEKTLKTIWINVWELSTQEEVWHAFLQAIFGEVYKRIRWWRKIDWRKLADQAIRNSWRILVVLVPALVAVYFGKKEYRDWGFLKLLTLQAPDSLGKAVGIATQILALFTLYKPTWDAIRKSVKFDLNSVLKVGSYEARVSELMKLRTRFAEFVNLAIGDEGRIVIFIDDLDRCTPDKVPDVLEAIKLFVMTKGCVYVLAFDEEVVAGRVAKKYGFRMDEGIKYLEKIVQIPFQLPPLDDTDIKKFISTQYEEVEWSIPGIFAQGLGSNPRTIKRALNTYRILRQMEQKRVAAWVIDPLDSVLVAKLVVIQTRFRRLYGHLIEDHDYLLELERWANRVGVELRPALTTFAEADDVDSLRTLEDSLRTLLKQQAPLAYFDSDQERDHVHWYICLGGQAAGVQDKERPDQKYGHRLLSNDPDAIDAAIKEIVPEGNYLPDWEMKIRKTYLRRLREILGDDAKYDDYEQRLSAGVAMDKFERRQADPDWAPQTVRAAGVPRLCGLNDRDVEKAKDAGIDLKLTESNQTRYSVEPPEFRIGRFPVTNKQLARFMTWVENEDPTCSSLKPEIVEFEAYWRPCPAEWEPQLLRERLMTARPAGYQVSLGPEQSDDEWDWTLPRTFLDASGWTNPITFRNDMKVVVARVRVRLVSAVTTEEANAPQYRSLQFELVDHPEWDSPHTFVFRIELSPDYPIFAEPQLGLLKVFASAGSKSGIETTDLLVRVRLLDGERKEITEPPSDRNALEVDITIWDKKTVPPLRLTFKPPETWIREPEIDENRSTPRAPVTERDGNDSNEEFNWNVYHEAQHPVTNVTWQDAVLYCIWLRKMTGVPYRLPTEIEWQLAAGSKLFPWGDDWADDKANTKESWSERPTKTTSVDAHPGGRSPYCAEDMAGNVWEWCADTFSEFLDFERTGATWHDVKMHGPLDQEPQNERCVRGGSYDEYKDKALASHRESRDANYHVPTIGFRVAVSSGWEVISGNPSSQKDSNRDTNGVADAILPNANGNVAN